MPHAWLLQDRLFHIAPIGLRFPHYGAPQHLHGQDVQDVQDGLVLIAGSHTHELTRSKSCRNVHKQMNQKVRISEHLDMCGNLCTSSRHSHGSYAGAVTLSIEHLEDDDALCTHRSSMHMPAVLSKDVMNNILAIEVTYGLTCSCSMSHYRK
jgi:hypothetical protein